LGDFIKEIEDIEAATHTFPTLVYLDPFGVIGVTDNEIKIFADKTRGPTEIFLRFDVKKIRRLKNYGRDTDPYPQLKKTKGAFSKIMKGLGLSFEADEQEIIKAYCNKILSKYFKYTLAFPIINPKSKVEMYWMCYTTDNIKNFQKISSVMHILKREYKLVNYTEKKETPIPMRGNRKL
jgi:three-Cys-motif partner protein